MDQKIELGDLVKEVADQLREARKNSTAQSDPVMQFTECELEMAFSVENEGKGGIKLWVFELGGSRTKTNSNTVRVKFGPVGPPVTFVAQQPGPRPKLGPKGQKEGS